MNLLSLIKTCCLSLLLFISPLISFAENSKDIDVVLSTGHNTQIEAIAVSSNQHFLATADNSKTLKIWDLSKNMEFRTFSGFNGRINQLVFAPDNEWLAGTTNSNELFIYNAKTGYKIFEHKTIYNGAYFGLTFSKDQKKLYFLNDNSALAELDLDSKNIQNLSSEDLYLTNVTFDLEQQMAYAYTHLHQLIYFDLNSLTITKTIDFSKYNTFSLCGSRISGDGQYLVTPFADQQIRIIDLKKAEVIQTIKNNGKPIMTLEVDPVKPWLFTTLHTGEVKAYHYKNGKEIFSFKDPSFIANHLKSYGDGNSMLIVNYNVIRFFNLNTQKEYKRIEPKISSVINMAYDQNGKYLAVATGKINIQIWDLRLNKIVNVIPGFFPCEFSPDGNTLYSMHYTSSVASWDVHTGELKKTYDTDQQLIQTISCSNDGKTLAASGFSQAIYVWDVESQQRQWTLKGHLGGIADLDFHPTKPILASGSYDQTLKLWDLNKGKEIKSFTDQTVVVSGVNFSPNGDYLASSGWDQTVYIRNCNDWSVKQILEGHTSSVMGVDFNQESTVLMSYAGNNSVSDADNSVIFWDIEQGQIIYQSKDHHTDVTQAFFDLSNDRVFSSTRDGSIQLIDYKNKETVATYRSINESEFFIYTPDHYYMASPTALKSIAFRVDNELFPFEQFDIYLNRPDIVANRIGKSPKQLMNAYEYLHKKRLRKYQLDGSQLKLDFQLPHLLIENDIPIVTTNNSIPFTIKAWDDVYDIQKINIYVNGTPIFGENGYQSDKKVKSIRAQVKVTLLSGQNNIQISAVNSNGAESFTESFEVVRESENEKPNLYIAAIGVSNYQDNRFQLTYPTKDAKDMVTALSESADLFNQIETAYLLDENMDVESFMNLESFFAPMNENDIAIIFMAGHGVLDANFDYYFGTYNMDFDHPGINGLAYSKIHELLGKIKAYRKLLIMDTCHSGELDKDEIETGPEPEVETGDITFRNAGVSVREKDGFGFENSVELMNDLFSDTRKGSGATVISSSGGAEYAMESDEWKNGLFTYAFISALNSPTTDLNKDGNIQLSEIRHQVYQNVKQISGGKQLPSSREENINQDYIIYQKRK